MVSRQDTAELRGWRESLLLCIAITTFSISLPVFNGLESLHWTFRQNDLVSVLVLILSVQIVPIMLLYSSDRLVTSSILDTVIIRLWRGLILTILLISVSQGAEFWWRIASICLLIVACLKFFNLTMRFFGFTAIAAIVFSLSFVGDFVAAEDYEFVRIPRIGDVDGGVPAGPVLVLLFDELSYVMLLGKDMAIDEIEFPNLSALAKDSLEFTNATANYSHTSRALPSMLSGEFASKDHDRKWVWSKSILTELASRQRVNVYQEALSDCLGSGVLCLRSFEHRPVAYLVRWGVIEKLQYKLPTNIKKLVQVYMDEIEHSLQVDYHNVLLDDLSADFADQTVFFYHSWLPHFPFLLDETGEVTQFEDNRYTTEFDRDRLLANYRRTIRFVDWRLGKIIHLLKTKGMYDKSVIVVTSDHGIRLAGFTTPPDYPDPITTRIPLLIKAPGLQKGRTAIDYQHVDFAPTMREILLLPQAQFSDGVSAFSMSRPVRNKVFHYLTWMGSVKYVLDQE